MMSLIRLLKDHAKVYNTVKPVLSGHLKIDKMKVLNTGCSLMQVYSIAESFCNTFDLY